MPLEALALVILAGFIHASWNIAAKRAGGDVRFAAFTSVVLMVVWAPLGVYMGVAQVPLWGWLEWSLVTLSAALHVGYYLFLLKGYRLADLTVVYPVARGSGPLISSLLAVVVLGETVGVSWALGLLSMSMGVWFIAGGPQLWRKTRSAAHAHRVHQGLRWGLITGVFIASYTVVDGYAVKVALLSPILVDYFGNLMRLVILTPVLLRDPTEVRALWRKQWKPAVFVGVLSPVSYVLVLYAVQMAPLSHVAPAREVSMLFAAMLGGHLLQEEDRTHRLLGAALMALGVVLLGWGA
jgi:drug/metabolite transporter (DMT)-like permease